jgi:hypothetical protein
MAPPARRPAQPHQARCLGGHAVGRHQLLLLTHRAEEAQRVSAEADQSNGGERRQAKDGAASDAHALTPTRGRQHEEGQHDAGCDLDSHAGGQSQRAGAKARVPTGCERQRGGEQQEHQRVVVGAANGQLKQHRVQAHERHGPARRAAQAAGGPRDERHRAEAREDRERLERPQPASDPQRGGRVTAEREQRAVGRVLEGPSDERVDRVGRRFGGDARVGVESVQDPHAGEREVAEHVLGDQRWAEQQDDVRRDDPHHEHSQRQRARGAQHRQVARAHDQHEQLEASWRDAHAETLQWASQPARPAAAAPGYVLGGPRRGAGCDQKDGRNHAEQAERA